MKTKVKSENRKRGRNFESIMAINKIDRLSHVYSHRACHHLHQHHHDLTYSCIHISFNIIIHPTTNKSSVELLSNLDGREKRSESGICFRFMRRRRVCVREYSKRVWVRACVRSTSTLYTTHRTAKQP